MSNLELTGIYYVQESLVFNSIINNEVFSDTVVYKYLVRPTSQNIFKQGSI